MSIIDNDLIKELGLEALSPDEQMKFLADAGELIHQNIVLRVIDRLSEEDKDELEKKIGEDEKNADQIIADFFEAKISNLREIIQEEIDSFKKESKSVLEKVGAM